MLNVAVIITVFNRKDKTLKCFASLKESLATVTERTSVKVFLTDDGSTDGTAESIRQNAYPFEVCILQGTGELYWNGGMINSWKAALSEGGWDGYLWLNNDTEILPGFWEDLYAADIYCHQAFGKGGIYVGSTKDTVSGALTYGGFVYTNKLTLKDRMIHPDGISFQRCEAAHGNITYVCSDVVASQGVLCEKYCHGVSDHDYTYLAYKAGFPVLVLPHYAGFCTNDHPKDGGQNAFLQLSLKERVAALHSPLGQNLHNALLFNKRCFPLRYPLVLMTCYLRVLFPKTYHKLYLRLRGGKQPSI